MGFHTVLLQALPWSNLIKITDKSDNSAKSTTLAYFYMPFLRYNTQNGFFISNYHRGFLDTSHGFLVELPNYRYKAWHGFLEKKYNTRS